MVNIYIVGNDVPQDAVDSASVFLFNLFMKDQIWSHAHSEAIRRALGPFPASAASTACNVVKHIISLLPEGWSCEAEGSSTEQCEPVREFGHNIPFKFTEHAPYSERTSSGYDSLSDDEELATDSQLLSGLFCDAAAPPATCHVTDQVSALPGGSMYTGEWLKMQCQSCSKENTSSGLEWQDLYSTVFEYLSSSEENSGIENQVVILNACYRCTYLGCCHMSRNQLGVM